ncbi:MAG: ABC transporter permease [Chloroflexota bacterium]|nr:ABC transporter permease [Chloroflexota bacterium]
MPKSFLVAKHEYLKMVRKRSFLLSTLGMPLLIIVVMAVSIAVAMGGDDTPLGYVDHAGVLNPDVQPPEVEMQIARERASDIEIRSYPDETSARVALEAEEIQGYYVIPEDYLATGQLELYYWDDAPGEAVQSDFEDFVRANLVSGLDEPAALRAFDGVNLAVRSADGSREVSEFGIITVFLPFIAGLFFFFAVMTSAQYLMRAVADEKENRTMEILVTSLTPEQLIGGKAAGLVCVALTQLLIWVLAVVIGLVVAARFFEPLRGIQVPWDFVLISLVYFLPSFVLMAGMMVAIGSTVTEAREGQQVAGILNILFTCPYFLVVLIFANPDGPIPVFLTLFPTTAYSTIAMRWGMTMIPAWQLAASLLALIGSAIFAIWAAARIFRVGMLNYGQRFRLRAVITAIRGY